MKATIADIHQRFLQECINLPDFEQDPIIIAINDFGGGWVSSVEVLSVLVRYAGFYPAALIQAVSKLAFPLDNYHFVVSSEKLIEMVKKYIFEDQSDLVREAD